MDLNIQNKSLPTPFEFTGDPRWSEDGELNKFYDLELEPSDSEENLLSDNADATTPLNTSYDSYCVDNDKKTDGTYSRDVPSRFTLVSTCLVISMTKSLRQYHSTGSMPREYVQVFYYF